MDESLHLLGLFPHVLKNIYTQQERAQSPQHLVKSTHIVKYTDISIPGTLLASVVPYYVLSPLCDLAYLILCACARSEFSEKRNPVLLKFLSPLLISLRPKFSCL